MFASWVTFLFETANFLLLAAMLAWFFFRPVRDALERRRSELEEERRAAASGRAEAERELREVRARRTEIEDSLEALRDRVRREAEREREHFLELARAQMQRERESLKGELASQRRSQVRSLARDAASAAREIVVRLLAEMEGPDLEQTMLRAACRQLEELRSSGTLAPLLVESANPLDAAAVDALVAAAGVTHADASHRVDPDLVVGLRAVTGRGLVDVSAAGLAAHAERVLIGEVERENANHG